MGEEEEAIVTEEGAALRSRAQKRRERLLRGQNERLSRIQGQCSGRAFPDVPAAPSPPTESRSQEEELSEEKGSGFLGQGSCAARDIATTAPSLASSNSSPSSFSRGIAVPGLPTGAAPCVHVPIIGFLAGALLWYGYCAEWWTQFARGRAVGASRLDAIGVPSLSWLSPTSPAKTMHVLCTVLFCTLRLRTAASVPRVFASERGPPGRARFPHHVVRRLCTLEVVLPLAHLLYTVVLSQLSRTAFATLALLVLLALGHKVRQLARETLAFWAPATAQTAPPSFWAQCATFGLAYYGHALAAYRALKDYAADHALFSVATAGGVTVAWMVRAAAAD